MNKVVTFEVCWCKYESGWEVVSLHKTIKGAYSARKYFREDSLNMGERGVPLYDLLRIRVIEVKP